MVYYVNRKRYQEDPQKKLGGGSEGAVYPFEDDPDKICVKLFHPPDKKVPDEMRIAKYRAQKIRAITGYNLQLPDQFVIPKLPAFDDRGEVIGYLMRRVPKGYGKLMKLLDPAFRTSNSIGLKEIALLYALFFEDLAYLHNSGLTLNDIVVGDINLGCNMIKFGPTIERTWVDADSWSYKDYPCLATTEMFCHPDLYQNLVAGGKFVPPQPKHDRFSYIVEFTLLGLHGAHPFRMGIHPRASGLQDRARAGITLFDKDVTYPKFLPSPEVLSDDLLHAIVDRLKCKTDEPLEPEMLRRFAGELVDCPKCNEQYHQSRAHCPKCSEKTIVDLGKLVELLIEELYKVPETLLFAQVIGNTLHMACRVNGKVHVVTLDDGMRLHQISTDIPAIQGARYRFFDTFLVVCPDPYAIVPVPLDFYRISGNTVTKLSQGVSTNGLENEAAVFDTSARFLYRTAGNFLLCGRMEFSGKAFSETPVQQVHQSQSWFTADHTSGADREALFGYDRALRDLQWFVIRGDNKGEAFEYHEVPLDLLRSRETMEDFAVYFNATSVLLVRSTRYRGRVNIRYSIIDLNGAVVQDNVLTDKDEGFVPWEQIHGKMFQKDSILHVTPDGVVKQTLATNAYGLLKDTQGVVTAEDRLFRFSKRICIARRNAILSITKKPDK